MNPLVPGSDLPPGKGGRRRTGWMLAGLVLLGVGVSAWIVHQMDRDLREHLLVQTRMVAQSLDPEEIRELSGTEADWSKPGYRRIKAHLESLRAAKPNGRFIYLLGQREDGRIFFHVDNVEQGHEDESPAGMIYEDAPEAFRRVFASGEGAVTGPFSDAWGMFISGAVPLRDPETGAVLTVVAVDIDAGDWRWDVLSRAAVPAGLVWVLLIVLGVLLALMGRTGPSSPKPILRRLLPSLAGLIVVMIAAAALLFHHQYQDHLDESTAGLFGLVEREFQVDMENHARLLAALIHALDMTEETHAALQAGDAGFLTAHWGDVYEGLRRHGHVTRFRFHDASGHCLARVDGSGVGGDPLPSSVLQKALQSGEAVTGLDAGADGDPVLSICRPVMDGDVRSGYVELGIGLGEILADRKTPGVELAVLVRKNRLDRERWAGGPGLSGGGAAWDGLTRDAVVWSSGEVPPPSVRAWLEEIAGQSAYWKQRREITAEGGVWRVGVLPLRDVDGQAIGDVLVMLDILPEKRHFHQLVRTGGAAGGVLTALILGMVVVWLRRTDLSMQARQAEVQEREARMADIFRHMTDAVWSVDWPDGRLLFATPSMERLYGREIREFEENPRLWRDVVHAEDQHKAEAFLNALRERESARSEWRVLKPDGTISWLKISGQHVHGENGDLLRVDGTASDITEQKKAMGQLQQIRAAIDDYSDSVLLADETGTATYINQAFGKRFKFIQETIRGADIARLFHDPEQGADILSDLLLGVSREEEVQMEGGGSTVFPALLRGSPSLNDRYDVVGFSLIITDLTERKRMESQLLHSQKLESVGQLAAGIAHEINTPIQFVGDNLSFLGKAFGDLLPLIDRYRKRVQSAGCGDETAELAALEAAADLDYLRTELPNALEQSKEGVRRVSRIVRAMKDFSHPGGAEKTPMDLNRAIATALTVARNEWRNVAEVETCLDETLPPVSCWPGDINQVLLNLILNAAQAIAEARPCEEEQKGRITIRTVRRDEWVEIHVQDNGTGIPEKHRSRIFTPFFTSKDVGKGTGQGLAMAYNIVVRKHGGDIRFETKAGEGTTFIVTLPIGLPGTEKAAPA
ncbi:MAG: PAS domain S-box protein [Lentisphaerae bacterium]|nr:PAS domain S-box protein [Lentisphaerota bacterium]